MYSACENVDLCYCIFQQEHSPHWLAPQGWELQVTQVLPHPGVQGSTLPRYPPPTLV